MNKQKYKCAISDTDILIDVFKSDAWMFCKYYLKKYILQNTFMKKRWNELLIGSELILQN